jgi:hypothetical protein
VVLYQDVDEVRHATSVTPSAARGIVASTRVDERASVNVS